MSVEGAVVEAGNKNIELSEEHFIVVEKLTKGRPKKTAKQVESSDNVGDLFAKLTAEKEDVMFEIVDDDEVPINSNKAKLSDEEKALKKAALEEERAAKKLEREAAIALEKEAKKVERETKAAEEKAAREAKVALEKAAREAKVADEKAAREAKRVLEKELKESKKASSPKSTPKATPKATPVVVVAAVSPAPEKIKVKPFEIDGKQYLKTENNVLYNPKTKEEIGTWDPKTKTIKELPEDEDEEEEEEGYETN